MFYYKLIHKYRLIDHNETKAIGTYSSLEKANAAIESLKDKNGFKTTINGFKIKKIFKILKPKLLDKTFWMTDLIHINTLKKLTKR